MKVLPFGTYLGKFIQAENPPAVVFPMEASACQNFEISYHFIIGEQHHK